MCFSSKVKTPKTNPEAIKAPEPVHTEEPKGVDFGASEEDKNTDTGIDMLKVDKTPADTGDGSSSATSTDTGTSRSKSKTKTSAPINRALKSTVKKP